MQMKQLLFLFCAARPPASCNWRATGSHTRPLPRLSGGLRCHLLLLACGLFAGLVAHPASAASGASYTIKRGIDPITVDGSLNETSWVMASSTSLFTLWDGSTAPASLQVYGKMLWDDQYLYIGYETIDTNVTAQGTGEMDGPKTNRREGCMIWNSSNGALKYSRMFHQSAFNFKRTNSVS